MRERLLSQSIEPVGNTPPGFAALMRNEHATWAKVIKAANVKVE